MSALKICKMGHTYQDDMNECPYCPKPGVKSNDNETVYNSDGQSDNASEKTQFFSTDSYGKAAESEKTQLLGRSNLGTTKGMNKTIISGGMKDKPGKVNQRKLVGWIVTYDNNENGADYKLFEGRNLAGTAKDCDIMLDFDSTISSKHCTILYRGNEFLFKDELSTNGTFINGEMKNEGRLIDGDKIKMGETEFLFRSSK